MTTQAKAAREVDGGYHAIKGFVFQFDTTILEALANPSSTVGVERDQDIDLDEFYIQVKYRTEAFSLPRIAEAVRQIVKQFAQNAHRRYRLYAHFSDRTPGDLLTLDAEQLTTLLAGADSTYTKEVKEIFLTHFEIVFALDLEAQFTILLRELQKRYRLKSEEEAFVRHGVLYHYLTHLVLHNPKDQRVTSDALLEAAGERADNVIFHGTYLRRMGRDRYLSMLKKEFAPQSVNVPFRQRLIIVQVDPGAHDEDLVDLAAVVRDRFYVPNNSPQPYLAFRGVSDHPALKGRLWDAGVKITDGTRFQGDDFSVATLSDKLSSAIGIRYVDESHLPGLAEEGVIQEVYEFFTSEPCTTEFPAARSKKMAITSSSEMVQVIGRRAKR